MGAGLAVRILYLVTLTENPLFDHPRLDGLFHEQWALSIAGGNILGDQPFFRAPFYAYFLGSIFSIFGHDYLVPRIVQMVLGSIGIGLLYCLGRRIAGSKAAFVGALLFALYPVEIYFEGEFLLESIIGVQVIGLCLAACAFRERPSGWIALLAGLLLGLITITRPPLVPAGLALLLFMFISISRSSLKLVGPLLLGLALPLLCIVARNVAIGVDPFLIASQGGINFYIGNNPHADGYSSSVLKSGTHWENRDISYLVEQELGFEPSPQEESAYWYGKGIEFILDEPASFLTLLLKKAYLFWNHVEIPNNQSYYFARSFSPVLSALPIGFGLIAPLGLAAIAFFWRDKKLRQIIALVLVYFITSIAFFVCDRFRMPVVPILCLASGITITSFVSFFQQRELRRITLLGSFCIVFGVISNSTLVPIDGLNNGRDFVSLAIAQIADGDITAARESLERADSAGGGSLDTGIYWASIEAASGAHNGSIDVLRKQLSIRPDFYPSLVSLASLYFERGMVDSAVFFGRLAIKRKPYIPAGYTITAQALLRGNDVEGAESALMQGKEQCGDDFLFGEYLLAGISAYRGWTHTADSLYRVVLEKSAIPPKQPLYEPEFSFSAVERIGISNRQLHAKALYGIGTLKAASMNLDSAETYFREAIALDPANPNILADLGVTMLRTGRFAEAVDYLDEATQIDSSKHLYWFNLGVALANHSRKEAARAAFVRCLEIEPDFGPANDALLSMERPTR